MSLLVHRAWSALAARGLIAILFGVVTLAWPHISLAVLLTLFAIYAAVDGIFAVVASFRAAELLEHEWLLGLEGVLSIVLGVLLFAAPAAGLLTVVWMLGGYAIAAGVILISLSMKLRGTQRTQRERFAPV